MMPAGTPILCIKRAAAFCAWSKGGEVPPPDSNLLSLNSPPSICNELWTPATIR